MATLDDWVSQAQRVGASDLHIEPGMPLALRVRGRLQLDGPGIPARQITAFARKLLDAPSWEDFLQRKSFDLSRRIAGVRCRINLLQTSRGVGMAIRLLSSFHATVEKLNLHSQLLSLLEESHGLILVSGPTGSGKSTTIAALVQEINVREARHIITLEQPIEYAFRPHRAFIRQREVGRDTPSFEQALLDAMREDPDVLVVGEMRRPETMRLTLNAAETGHLVISTLHSSTCAEALQRVVGAFPAEIQDNVRAQLADCLVAVVCQRLGYRQELDLRVPECEILIATTGVRSLIRQGHFSRLATAIETGGEHGMWSFGRYQRWLKEKADWHLPQQEASYDDAPSDTRAEVEHLLKPTRSTQAPLPRAAGLPTAHHTPAPTPSRSEPPASLPEEDSVFVLEPDEDLEAIVSALKKL